MTTTEHVTFCRICEPFCGMIATVEDGRLLTVRPDPEHPLTKGYACPKGMAYPHVQNDPERVLYPLKRQPDGSFEREPWDDAMADIVARVQRIHREHGNDAFGWYLGNPGALNSSFLLAVTSFISALKTPHLYSAGSQDTNSRFVASHLLYGSAATVPFPDLAFTEFLLILGANPNVSHGSILSTPRIKDTLHDIIKRGGRVVVADPRRTETCPPTTRVEVFDLSR